MHTFLTRPGTVLLLAAALAFTHAPAGVAQTDKDRARSAPRSPRVVAPRANEPPAPLPSARSDAADASVKAAFEPATDEELRTGYPLGTGDVVRVVVFQQPDMTTETRVSEAGTITVPLLGAVPVGSATAKRVEARVGALLKARGLVRDPQVVVTVVQFKSRQVSVLGMVQRPGRYSLEEGIHRLSDVLAVAGGILPEGADTVTLIRVQGGQSRRQEVDLPALFASGDFSANPDVMPGDSIYVGRAPVFYIYGEVNRPGPFRLDKGITVMQALSLAGGLTPRGTEKNVQIRRKDDNGQYVNHKSSLADVVQADDVVFVRESLF